MEGRFFELLEGVHHLVIILQQQVVFNLIFPLYLPDDEP